MTGERRNQLNRIVIKGYKSIKECDLELKNINVLIGANGAGKSNFISVFEMLGRVLARELSLFVQRKGINPLLYNGKEVTDNIFAEFDYGSFIYSFDLEWSDQDTLYFRDEKLLVDGKNIIVDASNYNESQAIDSIRKARVQAQIPQDILIPNWRVYQFHNTSPSSRIKSENDIANCVNLISDARNLAAFLYRLKQVFPKEYSNILRAVQMVAPFLDDFALEPKELNEEQIILKWRKKGCEDVFNAAQFSDGTLRFICLATLLLQPTELQPSTIIIDEPELGLHPFAITILAEMVRKAAFSKQIILATQSVELLDQFDVSDVIVVDHDEGGSNFKRLDEEQLILWLDNDYTLGELWNKNIFGGRP